MGNTVFDDDVFYFEDGCKRITLLDCNKYLINKSRIPMHTINRDIVTIPKLIFNLLKSHEEIYKGTLFESSIADYFLIDVLLSSYLIKSPNPVKIVEIGADYGVLSYHLASIAGSFNNKSSLLCVCNQIGEQSDNHLLENIMMVKEPPEYSVLITDYESTSLEDNYFDVVVINGSIPFKESLKVIDEAVRIVKKCGIIISYSVENSLLANGFSIKFDQHDTYEISSSRGVCMTVCNEKVWTGEQVITAEKMADELIEEIIRSIFNQTDINCLRGLIRQTDKCIDAAIKEYRTALKIKLIDVKERILNLIVNMGNDNQEYFKKQLIEKLMG